MKKLIDCFTFYNELEILELRLTELYNVVDNFIIVEADKTHKGENKRFFFEENKWRFKKFMDKIIHIKINFPDNLDVWGREKYQRNSFMPSLYSLGLTNDDLVIICDADEIPNPNMMKYIKGSYNMKGLYKIEMDLYVASLHNKQEFPKWYHAKIVDWETLKGRTPDECRLDFECQWWENSGWHLTYFGGADRISNKIENFAHQEYNTDKHKNTNRISESIKNGVSFFDGYPSLIKIDPNENENLPANWRILNSVDPLYDRSNEKKDLVLGAAINLGLGDIKIFIESFRIYNKNADVYMIVEDNPDPNKLKFMEDNRIYPLYSKFGILDTQPNNTRFFKFYDFIKENKKTYKNILISDVTDVVFQNDPFVISEKKFIFFANEDNKVKISENAFNYRWIFQCFGLEVAEEIKNNLISCCGTVIGSIKNIEIYLENMVNEMTRVKNQFPNHFKDMMDQGIHNYLCYKKIDLFENPVIKENGDFISTIGLTLEYSPDEIQIDYNNQKILVGNKEPIIVHQYNRSNELIEFYNTSMELSNVYNKLIPSTHRGITIYTLANDGIGRNLINDTEWEPHIIRFLENNLKAEDTFVDIGSNYGWHSIMASKMCNNIHSFEPQKLMYEIQKKTLLKNSLKEKIHLYNTAIGETEKETQMNQIDYDSDNINIGDLSIGIGGEKIKVKTLDSYNIERVDIIKIDVQGYEKMVLQGSLKVIENHRPLLIVEVEEFQLLKFNYNSSDLFNMIRGLGYEIYLLDYHYPSDHICVPLEKIEEFQNNNNIVELLESNTLNFNVENGIKYKVI